MASSAYDSVMNALVKVVTPPGNGSRAAKLEHLLVLALGYVVVRKAVKLGPSGLLEAAVTNLMAFASHVPGVAGAVEAQKADVMDKIRQFILGDEKDPEPNAALPEEGLSAADIITKLEALRSKSKTFDSHKGHGGVYHLETHGLHEVQENAFRLYNCSNALYPGIFPAVRKFEAECVRMVVTMLNGDANACGTLTSGGTESVLLAILAYREYAKKTRGITKPELIACTTAHAACDKACHYFGIKLVHVPFGADFRMDVAATRKAINSNTIAIYCSAPTFPHGAVDDVPALGKLAQEKGIGLHVDNCLGGFLLSSLKQQKLVDAEFDYLVPGVTSISVDIHKYGFAAKGACCITYANADLRRGQFTTVSDWSGGLYATPTIQGSRSGAMMAAAWGTLMFMGKSGYHKSARLMHDIKTRMTEEIAAMPGLKICGNPVACVVPFTSDEFDIYVLADMMSAKGWEMPRLQRPACVHHCISEHSAAIIDSYLDDLREAAADCMARKSELKPDKDSMAGIYGMASTIPDRSMVQDLLKGYMDVLYSVEGVVPKK